MSPGTAAATKLFFLCTRRHDLDPDRYRRILLTEHAPRILERLRSVRSLSIAMVEEREPGAPAVDAVVEVMIEPLARREAIERALLQASAQVDLYVTSHRVHRDELPLRTTGRTAAVKLLHPVRRHPRLSPDEFAHAWTREHVPKALRHHPAMIRYATNLVVDPSTTDLGAEEPGRASIAARGWHGFTEGYYRSLEDVTHRFFDSEEGRRTILADVARFLEAGTTYRVTEYVFA